MPRVNQRPNRSFSADGPDIRVIGFQQSLLGQHHRQRDTAEPRTRVVQEVSSIEQMTADEWVALSHKTAIPEPNPVGGAAGVQYARRSVDGILSPQFCR